MLWIGGIRLDFHPQPAHQLGQALIADALRKDHILGPNRLNQIIFLAYLVGMGHKILEQQVFFGG